MEPYDSYNEMRGQSLISRAEAARDAADWEAAVPLYEAASRQRPKDAGLLVQLGHCRKELGRMGDAEQAYLAARAMIPHDLDIALQLGHLYSLMGRTADAVTEYRAATAGGLRDPNALAFLAWAEQESDAFRVVGGEPVIYFDLSDLVAHLRTSRFPTGIQRVQIELFKASRASARRDRLRSCVYRSECGGWVGIDQEAFATLCELASAPGRADERAWREAFEGFAAGLSRQALVFQDEAILVNFGSSWWIDGYMASIRTAKRRSRLRYVPFVHDMIPLVAADYVAPGMTATFAAWIGSVYMHADVVAVNSHSTGRDVAAHAPLVRPLEHAPVVMQLNAECTSRAARPTRAVEDGLLDDFGLERDGFVLFVGTLEPRKNHLMVFKAWSAMLSGDDAGAAPVLVCVGKEGWNFEETRAYLESRPELQDKVLLLSTVSDEALHSLYECCLFTVYASHYEGWGLPVTESLCHGKVCLTARHSSLPEAGCEFAAYYEEGSPRSFLNQLRQLIGDGGFRRGLEAAIAAGYRPRPWSAVLEGLLADVLGRLSESPAAGVRLSAVEPGFAYRPTQLPGIERIDRAATVAEMMRFEGEWHDREPWGAWSTGRRARLWYAAPDGLSPGEDLFLYLEVGSTAQPVAMSASVDGRQVASVEIPELSQRIVQVRIPAELVQVAGAGGGVIQLSCGRLTPLRELSPTDERMTGFGLASVSFAGACDHAARMALIDRASVLAEA